MPRDIGSMNLTQPSKGAAREGVTGRILRLDLLRRLARTVDRGHLKPSLGARQITYCRNAAWVFNYLLSASLLCTGLAQHDPEWVGTAHARRCWR